MASKKSSHKKTDIKDPRTGRSWVYSQKVRDHFFHPYKFLKNGEEGKFKADGHGQVGSMSCGDMMKFWIKVDEKQNRIRDVRWQTFGCASAIASTSVLAEMLTEKKGMKIDQALKISPPDILKRLGGLPAIKVHCSVLGDKALLAAINDYFRKTKQYDRILVKGGKIVDKVLKITDQDIKDAVTRGAKSFKAVQAETKVGLGDPACLKEAKKVFEKYQKKDKI